MKCDNCGSKIEGYVYFEPFEMLTNNEKIKKIEKKIKKEQNGFAYLCKKCSEQRVEQ